MTGIGLEFSVRRLDDLVDGFIIVASEKSNWGEIFPIPEYWKNRVVIREPFFNHPLNCETDKRNFGIQQARKEEFTHFIAMDADEIYEAEPFLKPKRDF